MRVVPIKRQRLKQVERARVEYISLFGGEDLVTPPLSIQPGTLRYSTNYEPGLVLGYRRVDGFERLDGRPKPSEASYWVLDFDAGTAAFSVGQIVTGTTSTATGEVLVVTVTSGSWAGSDAAGYLVLFNVSGTFQNNEAITSSGGAATVNGQISERGSADDAQDTTWHQLAIAATRADIQAVPGVGQIRGVWSYKGVKYAFRDHGAPVTECRMYKATATGWVQVDLGKRLNFTSGGTNKIIETDVITGATSGATATVNRVVVTSGTWAAGDAAGYVILTNQTGNFQAENLNIGVTTNVATIAGNSAAQTLLPGGRYEFENYNFTGASSEVKMYGCDGVNKSFEYDGTALCPITTGMADDKPTHLKAHKNHLFLAFPGGSAQHSAIGDPLTWTVVTGAGEIGTGDEITGFSAVRGGLLGIFNRNRTSILYGTSGSDWELKTHSDESGAIEGSIQTIGSTRYLDDRGLTSLEAVDTYGDFNSATFSQRIQPLVDEKLRRFGVTASIRVRVKDQYRAFFSDGSGIIAKFRGEKIEFTRLEYGKVVRCACSSEEADGSEVLLFGSDDGYVYEMDAGTSFDGEAIEAVLRLPFGHLKSPQQIKRFYKAVLEIDASRGTVIQFTQEYDYGNAGNPRGITQDLGVASGGGYWGNAVWSDFVWGEQAVGTAEGYLEGSGRNIGIFIRSVSAYVDPHTVNGISLHFAMRGRSR